MKKKVLITSILLSSLYVTSANAQLLYKDSANQCYLSYEDDSGDSELILMANKKKLSIIFVNIKNRIKGADYTIHLEAGDKRYGLSVESLGRKTAIADNVWNKVFESISEVDQVKAHDTIIKLPKIKTYMTNLLLCGKEPNRF